MEGMMARWYAKNTAKSIEEYRRWITRFIFKHMLVKRAYRPEDMKAMAAASRFQSCELRPEGIGFEATFRKPAQDVASAA